MRIAYIVGTLAYNGGAERIVTEKMNYLSTVPKYSIYAITLYQIYDKQPNTYDLSPKVTQVNLQIPAYLQYKHKYPKRLWLKWKYYKQLRQELTTVVNEIKPDILIGVGFNSADIVCLQKCNAAKIIESHEPRMFTMSNSQRTQRSFVTKALGHLYRKWYLHIIEKYADAIVTLTENDAIEWKKARYVEVIPNFSSMHISSISNCANKKVIAVGRFEWEKGYDMLLQIWENVINRHPDWEINIYGDGNLRDNIEKEVLQKGLRSIYIHPFTKEISKEYAKSSIYILSSRFEGFSLTILEAMRHGLPCISFDCPFGPANLIENDKTGYLIENGNKSSFADKLSNLMENSQVRKEFSKAALDRAKLFEKETIMQNWIKLFESLKS